jgi:hypothetical protein
MFDRLLAWLVILLPTLFALSIELVSKEIKEHPYWRFGVAIFGIGLSGLTWFQISRADKLATAERQAVTAEVSENVRKTVTEQYERTVTEQRLENDELKKALAAQGKDVSVIKSSNIVTGKKPVKVEITNPPSPGSTYSRYVTPEMADAIVAKLAPFAGQKIHILVLSGEQETSDYGEQIIPLFKRAGWKTEINPWLMSAFRGLILKVHDRHNQPAAVLQRAFLDAGIEFYAAEEDEYIPEDTVELQIGNRK